MGEVTNQSFLEGSFEFVRNKSKKFTVMTGHFKSGKKAADQSLKQFQASWVARRMNRLQNEKAVILSCDFNMGVGDASFEYGFWQAIDRGFFSAYWHALVKKMAEKYPSTCKWRMGGEQLEKICDAIDIKEVIDFIFYNKRKMRLLATLTTPSESEILKKTGGRGLPSA